MATKVPAVNGADVLTMSAVEFTACLKKLPERLQYIITNSEVPPYKTISDVSSSYWGLSKNREDSFLRSYNNLIFL